MRFTMFKPLVLAAVVVIAAAGCRDKEMEKRIAELEAEVSELRGKKSGSDATVTPAVQTTTAGTQAATPKVAGEKPEGPIPVAQFATVEHDFGTIIEGENVEYTYVVKNTGEAPLIIEKAAPSCGCTVPDWTKTPIPPGGSGFVKAKFDSSGKPGIQNKTITVTANTYPVQTVLRFKAMVAPKAENGPAK